MAETVDKILYCVEVCSHPRTEENQGVVTIPEELAAECVKLLFDEIYRVNIIYIGVVHRRYSTI